MMLKPGRLEWSDGVSYYIHTSLCTLSHSLSVDLSILNNYKPCLHRNFPSHFNLIRVVIHLLANRLCVSA